MVTAVKTLGLAWMEFKKPKPKEIIEQFIQNGVEKLLYFSAAISADSIHSQYDIPELVHRARRPQGFLLVNMGAWNDDPQVIRAIKFKIMAVARNQYKIAWQNLTVTDEMVEIEGN